MKILLVGNYRKGVGGISGQMERLQLHLCEEGHSVSIFSTKGSVWKRLFLKRKLRKIVKNYDLLHIHCCSGWGFVPAVLGVAVGKKLGKRVVLTYHGGGGEKFFAKHTKLVRHYLTRTDANIVLSGFLGKIFDKYKIPYTVIPNIIELDSTNYRERESLRPHFICVRTHEPLYNIPCILRAFRQLQAALPEASLTLVGDGSQHEELKQQAAAMGLQNVIFTGRVDNNEIYSYLNNADIFLSAPLIDNMPVSLLEAMNAGLLIISSRVGGVPYIVEDGKSALLFESDNAAQLAEKMLWSLQHPEESLEMVRCAHKEVEKYQWGHVKEKLYSLYGFLS